MYFLVPYIPSIVGFIIALYWATKITIHGSFDFIPTRGLRATWICFGGAVLWLAILHYPLTYRFSNETDYFRTWFVIIVAVVSILHGMFSGRRGLILFTDRMTSPVFEQPIESDYDREEHDQEPDMSKKLPY